jgi:hypothetical protein
MRDKGTSSVGGSISSSFPEVRASPPPLIARKSLGIVNNSEIPAAAENAA